MIDIPDYLKSGEVARLIPVIADSRKEQRVVSVFLATLSAVPDFAQTLLASIGQRVGRRASINSYTEIAFSNQAQGVNDRPDGLVVIEKSRGSWTGIIEAKIGSAELRSEQVHRYLQLARENGVDAVITISNQFVGRPEQSAVPIPKNLLRKVAAFHWSWKYILTEAILLQSQARITDPDQAFLLREFVRFLSHASIGVGGYDRMPPEWKDVMTRLQSGATLRRNSSEVEAVVSAWHQEVRDLALRMSHHLAVNVENKLSRSHASNAAQRLKDDCSQLADKHDLTTELHVPGAASEIKVIADLNARAIRVGMELEAPQDRQRPSARVNWLLRQLKGGNSDGIFVRVIWPGRAPDTILPLASLRDNPKIVETEASPRAPRAFEVFLVSTDARRFAGRKTFIEDIERTIPEFYDGVGQFLETWRPKPPKPFEANGEPEPPMDAEEVEGPIPTAPETKKNVGGTAPGNDHTGLLDVPAFLRRD